LTKALNLLFARAAYVRAACVTVNSCLLPRRITLGWL